MKLLLLFISLLYYFDVSAGTSISVTDDEKNTVIFSQPPNRIISLSPHATELLFAAGASDQVVGTVSYSDFPPEAKKIPRIGSYNKIDLESVLKINPDLIVAWKGGGSEHQIDDLKKLGFKIYYSEPKSFEEVATNIMNFGLILGTSEEAQFRANKFLSELALLRNKFSGLKKVTVFYQVWNQPLMTINNDHLITDVIELCGGSNVYGELSIRAPKVNIESVIQKNPQTIIIGTSEQRQDWLSSWDHWQVIDAVKNKHVYAVNADFIVRQGPRILQGAKLICEILEKVRVN